MAGMVEPIGEGGTEVSIVPTTERPLSVAEIIPRRPFADRAVDALLGAVVGIGLDIVEGLGGGMEWAARRLNGNYRRYMEELENGHAPRDLE